VADVGLAEEAFKTDLAGTDFVGAAFFLGAVFEAVLFDGDFAAAFAEDFLGFGLMGGIRSTFIFYQFVDRL
jgi:hypothetical protein